MLLLLLNMTLSFLFLTLNHPMSMSLTLLVQTMLITLITGFLHVNFWFSYILFLIMIGGMLVLFIYMTSIASNEIFSYSNNMLLIIIMVMIFTSILIFFMDNFFINLNFLFSDSQFNNMNFNLIKYFNYPSMYIIFFMISYLFITLIAIVKITKIEYGPLRQKF